MEQLTQWVNQAIALWKSKGIKLQPGAPSEKIIEIATRSDITNLTDSFTRITIWQNQ
jgi:hypothetical protein